MGDKYFTIRCLKEVSDYGEVYFIRGKEYQAWDESGNWITVSESGNNHMLATENNRVWFKENFEHVTN